jgi:geranylgeranyl diphosphate synthase type II
MAVTTEDAIDQGLASEGVDEEWRRRLDARLLELMPLQERDGNPTCRELAEAMRYSLLAPGKRVRPLLAIRTAMHFDRDPTPMVDFGCALEMVHCASLILDDLPCMDDAETRRGRLSCHRKFGEATTTLAAVALLNHAFCVLARHADLDAELRCRLVDQLSVAVGTSGLVSGQCRDLIDRAGSLDDAAMAEINHQKTGVLFELATIGAGEILGLPSQEMAALKRYAVHLGQAFQAADDLLDARHHADGSGKDAGLDRDKAGSVHQIGEAALRERVESELAEGDRVLPASRGEQSLDAFVHRLFARFV